MYSLYPALCTCHYIVTAFLYHKILYEEYCPSSSLDGTALIITRRCSPLNPFSVIALWTRCRHLAQGRSQRSKQSDELVSLKNLVWPWLVWLSWLGIPTKQKVASSIPSQGTCLGCRPGPQWGMCKRQPHIDVSLPLFLPPFPSL